MVQNIKGLKEYIVKNIFDILQISLKLCFKKAIITNKHIHFFVLHDLLGIQVSVRNSLQGYWSFEGRQCCYPTYYKYFQSVQQHRLYTPSDQFLIPRGMQDAPLQIQGWGGGEDRSLGLSGQLIGGSQGDSLCCGTHAYTQVNTLLTTNKVDCSLTTIAECDLWLPHNACQCSQTYQCRPFIEKKRYTRKAQRRN